MHSEDRHTRVCRRDGDRGHHQWQPSPTESRQHTSDCNNEALHSDNVVYNAERSVRAENEHGNNRCIRFLNYNVGGLLPKLQIADIVEYMKSFHHVCLTETYVNNELRSDSFTEFCMFTSPAKKLSHQGRFSGGVIALIHKSLASYIKRLDTEIDNAIVFRIDKELFGTAKPVVMVFAYLPPTQSPYSYSKWFWC